MHLTPQKGRTGLWFHGNPFDNTSFIAQRSAGRANLTTFMYDKQSEHALLIHPEEHFLLIRFLNNN